MRSAGAAGTVRSKINHNLNAEEQPVTHQPEEWRPVIGYEGRYEVSNHGRVRSLISKWPSPHVMSPSLISTGYPTLNLYAAGTKKGRHLKVHRLVALAFLGPPGPGQMCRHLNGNPADNRVENLAWGTHSENMLDAVRHGTHPETRRTHCDNGHEFTPENTRIHDRADGGGHRSCRTCTNARFREMRRRKAAA